MSESMSWIARSTLVGLSALLLSTAAPAQQQLIPPGAVWKYKDNGSNQGTAWRYPGFNDSAWKSGAAQLGYGDGDEATEVDSGPIIGKHITTYFRRTFSVTDLQELTGLRLDLLRDDGVVAYLNGVEVYRDNMLPFVPVGFADWAVDNVEGSDEDEWDAHTIAADALVAGPNVLAVEIHQSSPFSSDISFDLELTGKTGTQLVRGPYLQRGTPKSITVRWRTSTPAYGRVWYGQDPADLEHVIDETSPTTEHEVELTGLAPNTSYHYAVGKGSTVLAGGDAQHVFRTAPLAGTSQPVRAWVLGDSGSADADAAAVRDGYMAFAGDSHTDVVLMLGDNAYGSGTDSEYQAAVFDMYPGMLARSVLWPTRGNHEMDGTAYFSMFTLPTAGEAGGLASGNEDYYSFDYGNVHFICLNSYELFDASVGGPMWNWLASDLASTNQEWIIAYWHHPPYSKGSHDSDTSLKQIQMRVNFLPLLEEGGVDLVLCGHSHCYERSYLIDGHYGFSPSFGGSMLVDGGDGRLQGDGAYIKEAAPHSGAVYCVAGSSSKTSGGSLDHAVMFHSISVLGSVVLDFTGRRMDARFLRTNGEVEDEFTIIHGGEREPVTAEPPLKK